MGSGAGTGLGFAFSGMGRCSQAGRARAGLSVQVESGRAAESQRRPITWECRICELFLEEPEEQRPSLCPALYQRAARMDLWSCNPAFSRVTDEADSGTSDLPKVP